MKPGTIRASTSPQARAPSPAGLRASSRETVAVKVSSVSQVAVIFFLPEGGSAARNRGRSCSAALYRGNAEIVRQPDTDLTGTTKKLGDMNDDGDR